MNIEVGFLPYLKRCYKKYTISFVLTGLVTLAFGFFFTFVCVYTSKVNIASACFASIGFLAFFWFLYFDYLIKYLKEKRAVLNEKRRKLRKNAMKLLYDTVKLLEVNDDIGALENVLTLIKVLKDILNTKGSRKLMREISIFLKDLLESVRVSENTINLSISTQTPDDHGPGEIISIYYRTASGSYDINTLRFI